MPLDTITPFTPWASLFGGIMIGLSAILVMALFGRIAGISGITTGGLLAAGERGWRLSFLLGLLVSPLVWLAVTGTAVAQTVPTSLPAMTLAGIAVGIGTALGSGCTSGHGVCGLARLSARSLIAVVCFMASGAATVLVLRHVLVAG